MTEKIQIPDTVHDMGVEHLAFYLELAKLAPDPDNPPENVFTMLTSLQVADLNTLFFNQAEGAFDKYDDATNRLILNEIAVSSMRYKPEPVRESITVNGKEYVFSLDFSKQPVIFHRDISSADFENNPLELAAFCYIEAGLMYNQIDDKTKVVLNERKDRAKAFEGAFTLAQYLDLQGFFLESWNVLNPFMKVRAAKAKTKNGTGKSQSIL